MKSKRFYKYCILATPKTGTYSVSQWVQDGEVIGHEMHDNHGIVSGFWFLDHDWYPFGHDSDMENRDSEEKCDGGEYTRSNFLYENIIALSRQPMDTINSIFKWLRDNADFPTRGTDKNLYHFTDWYKDIGFDMGGETIDQAIEIWLGTYKRILDQRVDHFIKIEEFANRWEEITGHKLPESVHFNRSGKKNPYSEEEILERMTDAQRELYEDICEKLGY